MSNQIELTAKHIKGLSPTAIAKDKAIGDHFVNKFMAMYRVPKEQANAFYEREKDNFVRRIEESESLQKCTPMSLFNAFMTAGGWKLSFEGGSQQEVYLIPGNRKVKYKDENGADREAWISEAVAQPSPYGEKKIRIETKQVLHVDEAKVVYDVDDYEEFTNDQGELVVKWKKGYRGEDSKIIGSFIRIKKADGTYEFKTFDRDDIETWRKASEKKNARNNKPANPLYTSNGGQIDVQFLKGKTLKHAFKLYPRVVNVPPVPENFAPIADEGIRNGFDTSEFTEDITHEDVTAQNTDKAPDEFGEALKSEIQKEPEPTVVMPAAEDDEPEF